MVELICLVVLLHFVFAPKNKRNTDDYIKSVIWAFVGLFCLFVLVVGGLVILAAAGAVVFG